MNHIITNPRIFYEEVKNLYRMPRSQDIPMPTRSPGAIFFKLHFSSFAWVSLANLKLLFIWLERKSINPSHQYKRVKKKTLNRMQCPCLRDHHLVQFPSYMAYEQFLSREIASSLVRKNIDHALPSVKWNLRWRSLTFCFSSSIFTFSCSASLQSEARDSSDELAAILPPGCLPKSILIYANWFSWVFHNANAHAM